MLAGVRIVLVAPSGPANVGAVARIMANMGLGDLVLVAPRCDPRATEAVAYATHGRAVLDAARIVEDIPAALAGCVRTYATTSKLGLYRRQAAIPPDEAATEALAVGGPVAFAFGREDFGLRTTELLHFDRLVTIPAEDSYPVLNLAAAATIVCYELHRAGRVRAGRPPLTYALVPDPAPAERKEVLFQRLFDALERVGFLFGPNPDHLKYALRHLLGRIDLTVNEADVLIGLARQIRWYVDHHPDRRDPEPAGRASPAGARPSER